MTDTQFLEDLRAASEWGQTTVFWVSGWKVAGVIACSVSHDFGLIFHFHSHFRLCHVALVLFCPVSLCM